MKKISVIIAAISLFIAGQAVAGDFDLGARYGRTVEQDGGSMEIAARYFPVKFISFGGSFGYSKIEYDKGWYYKRQETMPIGGFINAHLPLPFVSPYGGIGGVLYSINSVTSPNPVDQGVERTGTMTVQGGLDFKLAPRTSFNIEVRRLVDDKQTLVMGGFWMHF